MFFTAINLVPLIFTLFTGFGVVVHDTQLDHAAVTALSSPAAVPIQASATSNLPELRLNDQHVHTESVSVEQAMRNLSGLEPRLQSRFTDEKKYLTPKRLALNTTFDL